MSLTIGGLLVTVVGSLLVKFGFTETCANEVIQLAPVLIGSVIAWAGRVRKGDINVFGFRK